MLGPWEASGRGLSLASETLTLPLLALGASAAPQRKMCSMVVNRFLAEMLLFLNILMKQGLILSA